MKFRLFVAVLAVLFATAPVQAGEKKDKNFTVWFDAAQPAVMDWNSQRDEGGAWLVMGLHFSGCRIGRFRSCGLGFAWGTLEVLVRETRTYNISVHQTRSYEASWLERRNTLLVTAPQTIRLTDSADGDPEWDFTVTPFYSATHQRWGFMVGLSIGG